MNDASVWEEERDEPCVYEVPKLLIDNSGPFRRPGSQVCEIRIGNAREPLFIDLL